MILGLDVKLNWVVNIVIKQKGNLYHGEQMLPFVYPHWYTLPEIYKYIYNRATQETDHSPCPRK